MMRTESYSAMAAIALCKPQSNVVRRICAMLGVT
jgi:hypothetical protein